MKTLKTLRSKVAAFTLIELLVVISIIGVLASLAIPAVAGALTRGQLTQALNNARQLHLATTMECQDALTTGDTNLGWPGDLSSMSTVQDFATLLINGGYMHPKDAVKVFSVAGITPGTASSNSVTITLANTGFNIYKIKDTDPSVAIFITTKNYTLGQPLTKDTKPFGDVGFVTLRKGGDASVYKNAQSTNMALVGELPSNQTPLN